VLVVIVRGKPLKQLCTAVEKAGGEHREYAAPKPWELPKWTAERGRDLGLQVEKAAAKELVALVGQSQQRLSRELEKLADVAGEHGRITVDHVAAAVTNVPRENRWDWFARVEQDGQRALEKELPPQQRWVARRIAGQARHWTEPRLTAALDDLLRADRLLKSASLTDAQVMDELLLRLQAAAMPEPASV
jgi:DNA polymerase III delta subunit